MWREFVLTLPGTVKEIQVDGRAQTSLEWHQNESQLVSFTQNFGPFLSHRGPRGEPWGFAPVAMLLVLLLVLYLVFAFALSRGLGRLRPSRVPDKWPRIDVLVAAHNEAERIDGLLAALDQLRYPPQRWSAIIVDDRSTDATGERVRAAIAGSATSIQLLRVDDCPSGISGKKNALLAAIRTSDADIIVTTDADCQPQPMWLQTLAGTFAGDVGVVLGFSPVVATTAPHRFLAAFQWLDSLSLAAAVAGLAAWGMATTATARSFAYRRAAFDAVGGFGETISIGSGDDDLLLHRILSGSPWRMAYAVGAEALVPTAAATTWGELLRARVRHVSKVRHYPAPARALGAFLFVVNLTALGALMALISGAHAGVAIVFLLGKLLAELWVLRRARDCFSASGSLAWVPVVSLLHPLYVLGVGVAGLRARYQWKGMEYHS